MGNWDLVLCHWIRRGKHDGFIQIAYGLFFDLLLTLNYLIIQSKISTLNQHKNIYPSEKGEKKFMQASGSEIPYSKARQLGSQ